LGHVAKGIKVHGGWQTVVMTNQHDRASTGPNGSAQSVGQAAAFDPAQNLDVLGSAVKRIEKTNPA